MIAPLFSNMDCYDGKNPYCVPRSTFAFMACHLNMICDMKSIESAEVKQRPAAQTGCVVEIFSRRFLYTVEIHGAENVVTLNAAYLDQPKEVEVCRGVASEVPSWVRIASLIESMEKNASLRHAEQTLFENGFDF